MGETVLVNAPKQWSDDFELDWNKHRQGPTPVHPDLKEALRCIYFCGRHDQLKADVALCNREHQRYLDEEKLSGPAIGARETGEKILAQLEAALG